MFCRGMWAAAVKNGFLQGKSKPDFTGFLSVLLVRVKIFTRNYSFPLEIHFTILYSNKCDRRPIRFGPLAQLVRAVGS
jgi:hypothetical protein